MRMFEEELSALVGDDYMADDPKITAIKKLIDRYYLPRPLFPDGEPVGIGDEMGERKGYRHGKVERIIHGPDGVTHVAAPGIAVEVKPGHRVLRPRNPEAKDGLEIVGGETLYGEDGRGWRITGIGAFGLYGNYEVMGDCGGERKPLKAEWLTHEPPDTLAAVVADMGNALAEWGDGVTNNAAYRGFKDVFERLERLEAGE